MVEASIRRFSGGVFWNEIDTLLSDIRALWSNPRSRRYSLGRQRNQWRNEYHSKSATRTHGNVFSAGGGSEERYFASLRSMAAKRMI